MNCQFLIKNPQAYESSIALTRRELAVGSYILRGYNTKSIAYAFGVSPSAINNTIGRLKRKLSLSSRVEIASAMLDIFYTNDVPAISDEKFSVLDPEHNYITRAEQNIIDLIVKGMSNEDIARHRGISKSTVANHVHSIFGKMQVHSRSELAAKVQGRNARRNGSSRSSVDFRERRSI
jgi:DNA-binding NarL/FixJ family response regulator